MGTASNSMATGAPRERHGRSVLRKPCRDRLVRLIFTGLLVGLFLGPLCRAEHARSQTVIVEVPDAGPQARLAAREIQRYVYCRTGQMLSLAPSLPDDKEAIVVAPKGAAIVAELGLGAGIRTAISQLNSQQFVLKTVILDGRRTLLVIGGDRIGTLYGAYRLAECLGVRFFLHGDVLPDQQVSWKLPELDEIGRPLFELRGLNPWGSHPFGFDLWNTDDYKSHVAQMAKMRMNFIGMHCYPEGHPYAEPTVWVGQEGDFDERGSVSFSYPASYYNALFRTRWGALHPGPTGDYHFGAAMLFDRDAWGPEVMRNHAPRPESPPDCNDVFNRTGAMFRDAFTFARALGVKTCLGTESPLILPGSLKERLKEQGKTPAEPAQMEQVYEGMFRRIMATHPLDYYWLWTPESWTWQGNTAIQMESTIEDIRLAQRALDRVQAPFRLATCGWVLGPKNDRAGFDRVVPAGVALSAISRHLGEDPVDPAFAQIKRHDKWAIPWMEGDNGGLAVPQLWVGRTRRDAADARAYGCSGLMGLIWRTRILGPNIAALAQSGWTQPWSDAGRQVSDRDVPLANDTEGAQGGKFANYPAAEIAGTQDDLIYRTCRYDMSGYTLKVPNGVYRVTLMFCEPHFHAVRQRVCDVRLQGKTVLKHLDIFEEVGRFAAIDRSFDDVPVSHGQLRIEFVAVESLPCVSGIVVEGKDFVRKINCGGPAIRDFVADFPAGPSVPPERLRKAPCDDFYQDWAATLFGRAASGEIASIFARIDSRLPRPLSRGCPAGLRPDPRPWDQVARDYAFVAELEQCAPKITGAGNRARFNYWLGTMRYLRAAARLDCTVGHFQVVMKRVSASSDPAERRRLAAESALPAYREIQTAYRRAFQHLLETIGTNGGLATVMFWEQSVFPAALLDTGRTLEKPLETPLPPDLKPATEYDGPLRLFLPTVRTCTDPGESLRLKVIVLSAEPPGRAVLAYRALGAEQPFHERPLKHVARGVYEVRLPPPSSDCGWEYYVEATDDDGHVARYPATAPRMNQTVVVMPGPILP